MCVDSIAVLISTMAAILVVERSSGVSPGGKCPRSGQLEPLGFEGTRALGASGGRFCPRTLLDQTWLLDPAALSPRAFGAFHPSGCPEFVWGGAAGRCRYIPGPAAPLRPCVVRSGCGPSTEPEKPIQPPGFCPCIDTDKRAIVRGMKSLSRPPFQILPSKGGVYRRNGRFIVGGRLSFCWETLVMAIACGVEGPHEIRRERGPFYTIEMTVAEAEQALNPNGDYFGERRISRARNFRARNANQ